ncbi:MAG: 30S ribosomal protein S2 [Planctomycetes bacterium]|nr:30S ribosomal protein S2 [Planctomycetota bacterium]
MPVVTVRELLEAGVHFGHPASRWHPRMAPYIFGKRNGVHIIDVRKTAAAMVEAFYFLRKVASQGGTILIVGTKRQAKDAIRREADRCGCPFVAERWLGGTLTNLETIRQQIKRLEELERIESSGEIERFSKKMLSSFRREKRKVVRNLEGIRNMTALPAVLLIVDPGVEDIAVKEAATLRIPVVAMLDTDCDPAPVNVPIPANDDAMRSIDLVLSRLADAVIQGREHYKGGVQVAAGFSSDQIARVAAEGISSPHADAPAENAPAASSADASDA